MSEPRATEPIWPSRLTEAMVERYTAEGLWTQETMVSTLCRMAEEKPGTLAVSDGQRGLTWSQLARQARLVGHGLKRMGLCRGDRVIIQLPNWIENIVIRYALKRAGLLGVYVPITWRETEVRQVVALAQPRVIVAPTAFGKVDFCRMIERLRPDFRCLQGGIFVRADGPRSDWAVGWDDLYGGDAERQDDEAEDDGGAFQPLEVSLICVSSGSTGAPKLCESPEGAQLLNGRGMAERLQVTSRDVVGIFAPLDGGAGLMGWLIAVAAGARVVLAESFRSEPMLDILERERVSLMATVPAILLRILDVSDLSRWDLSALRMVRTGGAALSAPTAVEVERRLKAKVVPAAGSMEVLTFAQTGLDDPQEIRLNGSVGKPLPGNEVRIVEDDGAPAATGHVGAIEVRGAGAGSGYLGDLEATRAAWGELGPQGWFRTGDLGEIGEDGHVYIRGRLKDVVLRGGRNVFPAELESILMEHRGIREVAVVGIPSEALGEKTRAYVVPRSAQELTEENIREFLEQKQIATYKIPDEIRFLDELPRLSSAKVNRRKLRSRGDSTASETKG
ncbi:MAG: class I adenylate-forming enzyme family protein [Acidobacteriota bacterium]